MHTIIYIIDLNWCALIQPSDRPDPPPLKRKLSDNDNGHFIQLVHPAVVLGASTLTFYYEDGLFFY